MKTYVYTKPCTQIYIAELSVITPNWKPKCSTGEWLNKLYYAYTMEYYSATKRNSLLIHAIIEMDLKIIMMIEKKPRKKGICYMVLFLQNSTKSKWIYRDRRQISSCLAIDREWKEELEGGITKEYKETLSGWWICLWSWLWWQFHGYTHM